MSNFYIIAKVNANEYLTKVQADSAYEAEHMFLDRGVCGIHEYGCEACMAYDAKAMKTDAFIGAAMWAWPVSVADLMKAIDTNNERIIKKDAAEEEIRKAEKAIKLLQAQIEEQQKRIEEARAALRA